MFEMDMGQPRIEELHALMHFAGRDWDATILNVGNPQCAIFVKDIPADWRIVASEADGVVLTVSRGQQKSLAERAMELLDSIGANTAGIVFNRAQTDDMDTIQYSSSIPASALQSIPQQTAGGAGTSRLGPIAFAVASATNQSTAGRQPAHGHVNGAPAAPASDPNVAGPKEHS